MEFKRASIEISTLIVFILGVLVLIVLIIIFRQHIVNGLDTMVNWFKAFLNLANESTQNIPSI